jgi:hypothetical protein
MGTVVSTNSTVIFNVAIGGETLRLHGRAPQWERLDLQGALRCDANEPLGAFHLSPS